MVQESDSAKSHRPMPVGPNAMEKLLGIPIPLLRSEGQVSINLIVIPHDLFAIEIVLAKLLFG